MIGYVPGKSPLHRAHPYTVLAVAAAIFLLAFALSTAAPIWILFVIALALLVAAGDDVVRAVRRPALLFMLPPWAVLLVLHGLLGDAPRLELGPLSFSRAGLDTALVLAGRIGTLVLVSVTTLATVSPARVVEAETARGAAFARTFLLVSTLTFLPRTRARAAQILEAQQLRGLRLGGAPVARLKALGPLVLPLVLGALGEVDEQVLALESRGSGFGSRVSGRMPRRTALEPPPDSAGQRALRLLLVPIVLAAYAAKFAGVGL
jgi:energy-coupling factor transport system permease protein